MIDITELCKVIAEWEDREDTWPEMGMGGATCGDCGHALTIVRPGKYQCDYCGTLGALAQGLMDLMYIRYEVLRHWLNDGKREIAEMLLDD